MIDTTERRPPPLPLSSLFLTFLRFGALAWGGPVAQIAMIREELVERARWMSLERFNRALAVYQALPGPEAHELCVYFGMQARGRWGGLVAGVGFMLPGLVLMLLLSWWYAGAAGSTPIVGAAFVGMQPAVMALIVRGIWKIGSHAIRDGGTVAAAGMGVAGEVCGIASWFTLVMAGAMYWAVRRKSWGTALVVMVVCAGVGVMSGSTATVFGEARADPGVWELFGTGLRAGLLTFGGAYTAIPLVRADAVGAGWISDAQFLDTLGLSGVLPAPLIIFGTGVGYLAGGWGGAAAMTIGIFLPAFAMTMIGHEVLERIIDNERVHAFLDGVTAAAVGVMAGTAWVLLRASVGDVGSATVFIAALYVLLRWKNPIAVVVVMLAAAAAGALYKAVII
jgi:chromate transporter